MNTSTMTFELPDTLNATMPPERRGVRRDFVRMMVLDRRTGGTHHTKFYHIGQFLKPGDLLVLNASRTLPAVLQAEWRRDGELREAKVELRLSRRIDESTWEAFAVEDGISLGDVLRFSPSLQASVYAAAEPFVTLRFSLSGSMLYDQIYRLGEPVRYEYVHEPWDLDYYQTIYGSVPGSVEMPSAGRAFSWELLFKLQRQGIGIAYVQLHTGLSYIPGDKWHMEPKDHFEQYAVPEETVLAVKRAKQSGGRVIAVGTTVVRTLETAVDGSGELAAGSGWTNLQIDEAFQLKVADGLITGFHEPEASHLDLLSAFMDPGTLTEAYKEAIRQQYLWHEFGDMNLIL
ncbi:S-adenosylmethionine:tRNA ribosyltransferase-isomerase [Paenibacillus sp. sptzw28]|uniref:S-adenosylmethionine:tRNA ribosyltransferase-isomerase n=1 Tax=Paenibacillus sp. sptzw28 TaxID=715179 RepID=UPI001C6DEFAB|nr:S-adenosylmethionine:tRNA ribosyltransferase-isomerase [Paenibacillus sp. sptzw28]QYR21368.1 S-adenosylmethionine:tRNA ribosyltransferase-isomerase [Paenibacillus sp. sptzw28]